MISDVLPGSPAEAAGLRPRDIIDAVDGASISTLPYYAALMYLHDSTVPIEVTALRGGQTLQFQVPAVWADERDDSDVSIDPLESPLPELGILGKTLTAPLARLNGLRSDCGVLVVGTTAGNEESATGLAPGDVIGSLNGEPVGSLRQLREAIHELARGTPAVLQVERRGLFVYIEQEIEPRLTELRADRTDSRAEPDRVKR